MPAPKKSTKEKKLAGTYKPSRETVDVEPVQAAGQIEMPDDLSAAEQALWTHAVANSPKGLLSAIDQAVLRTWVSSTAMANEASATLAREGLSVVSRNGYTTKHPCFEIWHKATAAQARTSAALGFDPLARSKVRVEAPKAPERNVYWFLRSSEEIKDAAARGEIHPDDLADLRTDGHDV